MAINLEKGNGICLDKGLSRVAFTVSWDTNEDVDISAMLLENGRGKRDVDFVFFNNLQHESGAVKHSGDIRDGAHALGVDDEVIDIYLNKVPANITEIVLVADIYNGASKGLHFGKITNSTAKIVDLDTNRVLASFQLDKDLIGQTTCELARVVRDNGAWKFENLSHPVMSLTGALTSRGF